MARFIFIVIVIFFFNACKTAPYFKTSNDFYRQEISLDLLNGDQLIGETSVLFEQSDPAKGYIEFKNKSDNSIQKIPVKNIKGYTYKKEYYVPKYVDLYYTGSYNFLFVKRLTKENSKIQFYELHQLYKSNDTGEELYYYFISLPNHSLYETWNIYSKNLVPNFEIKMSAIVDDCPKLAAKIKERANGYFLSQVSFSNSKKVEVFERIIEEYNNCK
jgi:hypothetical protein